MPRPSRPESTSRSARHRLARASARHDLAARAAAIFAEHDPEEQKISGEWLDRLNVVRTLVPLILTEGVRNGDDFAWYVAEVFGDDVVLKGIQELDERLHAAGVEDTTVGDPYPDNTENRSSLTDAVVSAAIDYAQAGYLVGLAVGMQLGPDALKGGGR